MLKTQVVILNWNGEKWLSRFLARVVATTPSEWGSVIVADNGSTDSSEAIVRAMEGVEWLPLGENFGFAEGYNRALAQLDGEVFVLLNSDVEPADGWLEPLVRRLEERPEVGALQPKIRSYGEPDYFEYAGAAGGFVDCYGYPFCRGRIMSTVEKDEGQYDEPRKIFWASGACMVIRSEVWRKSGGLDGDFFAHMEEIDLCWRLQLMGYEVEVVPQSVVYHMGGGTLPNNSPRKIYFNYRNSLSMLHKCLPERELWRLGVRRAMDWLSWGVYVLSGKWGFAGAVVRAHRDYCAQRAVLEEKRRKVQQMATNAEIATIYPRWMVWRYYVMGKRRFGQLGW
ncbi:MAG: glycosyltransferase family 2 protein [Tidjanibacter sp.]|nr:glycosyltransferase family 2 protein [Tidjanibacter sp.]